MHIHLDPVGGIAGDMFVAALLDLFPDLAEGAIAAVRDAGLDDDVALAHVPYNDGILGGSRFEVSAPRCDQGHADEGGHHHHHVHWSGLRRRLLDSALTPGVCTRTVDIFTHLAEAEARVHDKPVDSVAFHEVGAWDSIADIVAAAFIIDTLAASWSIGAIPVGSGRVATEHGLLPVPAPATVLLLEGFACFDDGFPGERVTPTGAAIIRYLDPRAAIGLQPLRLGGTGLGFGTRRFNGLSNVLRAVQFYPDATATTASDQVTMIQFEVDDQTAEDLALGLERLRAVRGVRDVTVGAVAGKQGRVMSAVQVLADPEKLAGVTDACFHETTTIGVRVQTVDRLTLPRREVRAGAGLNVKVVERPNGPSAKADLRDVADGDGHGARQAARHRAEREALREQHDD